VAGVPQEGDGLLRRRREYVVCIVIAIGAGEDKYAEFHGVISV